MSDPADLINVALQKGTCDITPFYLLLYHVKSYRLT
jgi:hypothetical protein